jgi:hypothetical protein
MDAGTAGFTRAIEPLITYARWLGARRGASKPSLISRVTANPGVHRRRQEQTLVRQAVGLLLRLRFDERDHAVVVFIDPRDFRCIGVVQTPGEVDHAGLERFHADEHIEQYFPGEAARKEAQPRLFLLVVIRRRAIRVIGARLRSAIRIARIVRVVAEHLLEAWLVVVDAAGARSGSAAGSCTRPCSMERIRDSTAGRENDHSCVESGHLCRHA